MKIPPFEASQSSYQAVVSTSADPYFNLAMEDHLLQAIRPGDRTLYLYRNSASVVIGRHQNPWIECDLRLMGEDGVLLVRRQSGGGAVYHDEGNTNYSFLSSRDDYDQDTNHRIVLDALGDLGIQARRNDRNDLVVGDRKFSGSAFRHRRERSFHHGTLLISADLDRLTRYLAAPNRSIDAKGTASVRSRVINLREVAEISHPSVTVAIARRFYERFGSPATTVERVKTVEPHILTVGTQDAQRHVRNLAHELGTWDWLYGKSPDFTHSVALNISGARVAVSMHVHRGLIDAVVEDGGPTAARPTADAREAVTAALTALCGCRYESEAICRRLTDAAPRQLANDLCKILQQEIP